MNVQEFLKDLAKKAKVDEQSEDFQMIISASALKEVEMPGDVINTINQNFLTRDAALNDKDINDSIYNKHKGNIYSIFTEIVDSNVSDLDIDDDFKEELKQMKSAPDKLKGLLEKAKGLKREARGKKDEEYNKIIQDLNAQLKEEKSKLPKREQELLNSFKEEKKKDKFTNKIFQFDIADNVPGGKEYLANAIYQELNSNYHIDLSEGGLDLKDKEDPTRDVYKDNTKVTFDDLLKQKIEPFTRKSPPKPDGKPTFNTTASEKPKFAEGSLKAIAHQRFMDDARKVSQQN